MKNKYLNIGTWNIRKLNEPEKLHLLLKELEQQKIDITGLAEIQWKGHFMSSNDIILYRGSDAGGQCRVAIVLIPRFVNALISFSPISPRLIHARVNRKQTITNLVQVYTSTSQHNEEEQEDFYDHLQILLDI